MDTYGQTVADHANNAFVESFTPPAEESATIIVWLRSDGSLEKAAPVVSSSEQAQQHALDAAKAASPFPAPPALPALYRECFRTFSITLSVDWPLSCDAMPQVVAYIEAAQRRVLEHLDTPRDEPGSEQVLVAITLHSDGRVAKLSVLESPSPRAGARVTAAVNASSPFPPPPEFATCFSGQPVLLSFWVLIG